MKKTNWFGPARKPELNGVYETRDAIGIIGFQHWNGEFWGHFNAESAARAQRGANKVSAWQVNKWRGLASDPSKGA